MLSKEEYLSIREQEAHNRGFYDKPSGEAAPPHTICLSVNNRCFMRCRMCDIGAANANAAGPDRRHYSRRYADGKTYRNFPLERIEKLIDETRHFNPVIKTNFVEPLLFRGLAAVAGLARSRELKFYTVTNGWLLNVNAPWMAELPVDLVRVSLDGPEEIHDGIRGKKGSYRRAVDGIKTLLELRRERGRERPIVGVCFTISDHNFHALERFMTGLDEERILKETYVNFNHLLFTTPGEVAETRAESRLFDDLQPCSIDNVAAEGVDTAVLARQIEAVARRFDPAAYHYYYSPALTSGDLASYYDPETRLFPRTPCYLPWYAAQIDINGNVGIYGHCILPPFGNVMERPFLEVWNSERAREIRRALRDAGSFAACNKCIGTLYPLRGRE